MGSLVRAWLCALVLGLALVGCGGDPDTAPSRAQRMDRALDRALAADPQFEAVRAVLIAVDGETVLERYVDSGPDDFHPVASITKSVVSTLVGIAVDRGLLSLDATLADLLPSYADRMRPRVSAVTLRHLLTMTGGFPEDTADDLAFAGTRDHVAAALRTSTGATTEPVYSSAGAHVVAAVLREAVGTSVLEFARSALLDPLGVPTEDGIEPPLAAEHLDEYNAADFAWPVDPQGVHLGWGLLKLRPVDLLAFGQLFLDLGVRDDEQVVPETWVREATTEQAGGSDMSYGYEWWIETVAGHPMAMAAGDGGQLVVVCPGLDLVAVTVTELDPTDLSSQLTGVNIRIVLDIVVEAGFGERSG